MKILIIQQAGHHEINKHFRESLCLEHGFKKLGHECVVWGDKYDNFTTISFSDLERWCDIIFIVENYFFQWLPIEEINKSKKTKLWWTIDSHVSLPSHKDFANSINFDVILSSTERYIDEYKNVDCYWLPNCYPDNLIRPYEDHSKHISLGFCGSLMMFRLPRIKYMQEHYNLKLDAYVMGDEMVEAIGSYFLHFNQNVADDINYRTFETSGCRTALLTNYTTNLEKLFDLDKEMLVYRNETELYSLLDKYLEDKQYLLKMGDLAYRNASQNHTYTNRCQRIIDILS